VDIARQQAPRKQMLRDRAVFMRKSKSISGYRERQPEGGLSEFLHADHLLVQAAFLHFAMKLFLAAP